MATKIKCTNCGKVMAVRTPDKPGVFKVKCTGCGTELKFSIGHPKVAPQAPANQPPMLGQYEVSKQFKAVCPLCHGETSVHLAKKGMQQMQCSACGQVLMVEGMPAKTVVGDGLGFFHGDMRRGIIRVHKGGISKMFGSGQQMMLKPGSNIIGRFDPMSPSNFNLNDKAVSRRSLDIFVDSNPSQGITFRLTVLKASNPVYHNGQPLRVGDSLALKFGDTIKLGATTLDFIPEHK